MANNEERIQRHIAFWNKDKTDRPLVGFKIGGTPVSRRYKGSNNIIISGKRIEAEDVLFDYIKDDYERKYCESLETDQDAFYTATPFTCVPWMEAILGCEIYAAESSLVTKPYLNDLDDLDIDSEQIILKSNKWLEKYLEFIKKLERLSNNRYPVGQPILRGPIDILGAIRGQQNLVFDLIDNPDKVSKMIGKITELFLKIIKEQQSLLKTIYNGYSMGFYDLWSPGKCIWLQEDITSLLSPELYRKYLYNYDLKICNSYDYTLFHLHPTSLYILDELLTIDNLKVIQLNKDEGGIAVSELMPYYRKIMEKKRLLIWGDLSYEDINLILNNLSYRGLYLQIIVKDVAEAKRKFEYIKEQSQAFFGN
jgi:hypothetical protein